MEYISTLSKDHPNWTDVDIEKVCRICLQPDNDLLLIFDELNFYNKIPLARMITECSNCTVERHDDYPYQICKKCIELLKICYNFRLKCKKAHTIAKIVLKNAQEFRIPIMGIDNLPPVDKFTQTEGIAIFPCEKCDEKLKTIEKLRVNDDSIKKFICKLCSTCETENDLEKHPCIEIDVAIKNRETKTLDNDESNSENDALDLFTSYDQSEDEDLKPLSIIRKEIEHMKQNNLNNTIEEPAKEKQKIKTERAKKTKSKPYCKICQKLFTRAYDLRRHERTHLNIKPYNCVYCNKHFTRSDHFNIHLRKFHSEQNFKCEKCNEGFIRKEDFLKHVNQCTYEQSLQKVKIVHNTKAESVEHLKTHDDQKPYVCSECGLRFVRNNYLIIHMRQHNSEKPFKSKMGRREHLRKQLYNVHNQNFKNKTNRLNDDSVQKYICKLCSTNCKTENDLKTHSCSEKDVPLKNGEIKSPENGENHSENDAFDLFTSDDQFEIENFKPLSTKIKEIEYVKQDDLNYMIEKPVKEKQKLKTGRPKKTKSKPYCKICQKMFTRAHDLRRHERTHLNIKPYNCVHCNKNFTRSDHLNIHLRKFHSEHHPLKDDSIKKYMCSTNCETENDLKKHSCIKNDVPMKNEEIQNIDTIAEPVTEKINTGRPKKMKTKPYCKICQKTFTRGYHLRRHERSIHLNEKPYSCVHCNKKVTRPHHLIIHMTRYHSELQPFKCTKCNKGFVRKEHLEKHEIQCTNDPKLPKVKKPKCYICEICKKGFTTERHHRVHVNNHSSKTFSCKFCKIVHKTKAESVEHLKTHDNEKPYLCSECGLRFPRNSSLIIHIRRHNGEKPYKCKFCDKGFPRAHDLTVHERYHTGEKSHICVICGKGFQRAYSLVVHMRVHTGEKPYKCSHCSISFTQGNDLKAHIRRHTGERFRCEICDEGFIQRYQLKQHKKSAHDIHEQSFTGRLEKITVNRIKKKNTD